MVSSFISSNGKNIAIFVGFIFASEVAWRIYKKYSSKKKGQLNFYSSKPIAEALFFSEQSAECRNHIGDGDIPCELSSCPVNSIKWVSMSNDLSIIQKKNLFTQYKLTDCFQQACIILKICNQIS